MARLSNGCIGQRVGHVSARLEPLPLRDRRLLTGLTIFWNKYRCVAVTQGAVYVLDSSRWSGGATPQRLLATLPRRTQLGPVSGRWAQVNIAEERGWVHKRFHDAISAADRDAGFGR